MMSAAATRSTDRFGAFVERFDPPRGPGGGLLDGTLVAIKDMVDVAGAHIGCGLGPPGRKADADAPIVAQLISAGARIAGLTAMTALAYEPSGANAVQGRPRNPWNDAFICGGSSSGSAVAVAAGLADCALGSDTGGSLRIPAHCCGIAAWKPTHGLLPVEGTMPLAPSLDTIGFLARDAGDLSRLAAALLPERDQTEVRRVAHLGDLTRASAGKIAEAVATVADVAGDFATVTEHDGRALVDAADAPALVLLQGEAARAHADLIASGGLDPVLAKRLAKGRSFSDAELAAARAALARQRTDLLEGLFCEVDALILPVMPIGTPRVEECEPDSPAFSARTLYALSAFTRFVNGLGLPAVALPAGFDSHGMPVAVQIVGRPGADRSLLHFARELQTRLHPHGVPHPPVEGNAP